jgi:hypothetical protein
MKKKYNIPKSFTMGGQNVKVVVKEDIGDPGNNGGCNFEENIISVQSHQANGDLRSSDMVEQTYWHEYAHFLLSQCRREDLSKDENLVDLMGEFLYQSIGKKKW